MAHFVKINSDNIVIKGAVVSNDIAKTEQDGIDFLKQIFKDETGEWLQTSYNTFHGYHKTGGTPFRKNYAGIGFYYDRNKDAFIPNKPYNSWILNESIFDWEAPIPYPTDGNMYDWDESNINWKLTQTKP